MRRQALVFVPALTSFVLLVVAWAANVDDSGTVPLLAASVLVSGAATYVLASREGGPAVRWAALAGLAGAVWFGILLFVLWQTAVWVFDPD